MSIPKITTASVKVMRSFDYCHFEVALGLTHDIAITKGEVDDLRKDAARLADKAVEQYKIAKANFALLAEDEARMRREAKVVAELRARPELLPEDKARVKAFNDHKFRKRYSYEDDWEHEE